MDLAKFLSLLERASLYFCRVDRLSESDRFEGDYTKVNATFAQLTFKDASPELLKALNITDERLFEAHMYSHRNAPRLAKQMRETCFVNSWHVLDYESAAMWAQYVRGGEGIAIQSTRDRLVESLANYADFDVYAGVIRYIDYEREAINLGQGFFPIMHKRKSFEHEHELRAVIWDSAAIIRRRGFGDDPSANQIQEALGLYVTADLEKLVERILRPRTRCYLSWYAPCTNAILAYQRRRRRRNRC